MELKLDKVSKRYGSKRAVDRISLEMEPGVYGLLGANGAGKTTLMRMMAGILRADGGEISMNGKEVKDEAYRELLGYLPQEFGYYPKFTANDFMLYMASLKGLPKNKARIKTQELLELVNLTEVARKKIRTYSGGMKQRLGIAQALLNDPGLLILDEPTAGLDPKERVKFRNMISRLRENRIILLSTHIVSDVEYIADQILIMKDGVLLHQGTLEDILETLRGRVWECTIARSALERIVKEYTVVNIREEKDTVFLRLVGESAPIEKAVEVSPALEDLYLFYFSKKGEMLL